MNLGITRPLAALLFLATTAVQAQPTPLFEFGFEDNFAASANSATPATVPGIAGQAGAFAPGQALEFDATDKLHKPEGTIAFWIKLPPTANKAPFVLFSEEGPDTPGSNRLRIEVYPERLLRFHLNDTRDSKIDYHGVTDWKADEWHHVAITWNHQKGGLIFVDGRPAAVNWIRRWEPVSHSRFFFGSRDASAGSAARVALDEIKIFDRELTEADARAAFQQHRAFTVDVTFQDPIVAAEKPHELSLLLRNPSDAAVPLRNLRYELLDASGRKQHNGQLPDQSLAPRATKQLTLPLAPAPAGRYSLRLTYLENGEQKSAEARLQVVENLPPLEPQPSRRTLLTEIVAADQKPVADLGHSTRVQSSAGTYREAGPRVHDRFVLEFEVEDVDEPHVAVITYPDDKPRSMEVLLQNFGKAIDFQVHSGIYAGDEFPLSHQMREHEVVFWPRARKQGFTFMTAEHNMPAAVESIRIYRLHQFAVSDRSAEFKGGVPARRTGIYYEDPVLFHSFGTDTDLDGFMQATDRLVRYLRSFGQTEFEYPLAWYGGPLYGTAIEPFEPDITGGQGGIRPHAPGYPRYLLQRLGEQDISFTAGLHIHTLPSLDPHAITDRSAISAEHDTIINVYKTGELRQGYWHGSDTNYNPADPRVMAAVNAIVDEVVARYGKEPAFDGVTLVVTRTKLYDFGSIESGYNDSNLVRFQQASGIKIPTYSPADPERHRKSYDWLMSHPEAKEAWIDWRCQVLHRHYAQMAERIAAVRPDLKLKLNVFVHPSQNHRLADYLNVPSSVLMREMGIDPALYKDHPNIVLNPTTVPADLRWMRRSDYLAEHPGVSRGAFTAPEVAAPLSDHDNVRVTIHDRYWEDAIGKEAPLQGLTDIGVQEMVWRASTLNPAGFNSLEPYVFALHHLDATNIVKGGYVLGTLGMEDVLEPFSRAFGSLPAVKFDDVPGAIDPVRIRQRTFENRHYFYVLNTLPEPVKAVIILSESGSLSDPVAGTTNRVSRELTLSLAPYELRTFVSDSTTQRVQRADVDVSAAWLQQLESRLNAVLAAADAAGAKAEKWEPYLTLARTAWANGHYSRVHFLLQDAWANELAPLARR
jgi:Uncharacterized protein conserved in bacteria